MGLSINFNVGGLPLFSFGGGGGSGGGLTFPADLRSTKNFILFRALKDFQLTRSGVGLSTSVATIALPVPSNLSTSYNAQYSVEGLGPVGAAAAEIGAGRPDMQTGMQRLVDKFDMTKNKEGVNGALLNLASTAAEGEIGALAGAAAGGGAVGAAAGAAATQAVKGLMAGAGIARNPHLATLFTGTNFRTHTFQYKLIARSPEESAALRSIIYKFKYHMAPSYMAGGHFFNYPEQWDIDIYMKDYLFDIGTSVLTQFDVNYAGEGAPYFFEETNAPFSVQLSLTFQEVAITTKQEIAIQGR